MGVLDVELSDGLIEDIKDLAERHYGDASDDSIRRVGETALAMRLLWLHRVEGAGAQVEEPAALWESPPRHVGEGTDAVLEWIFEGRRGQ